MEIFAKTAIMNYSLSPAAKENKLLFSISVFHFQQTNEVAVFR
jgi:hypothetical protein